MKEPNISVDEDRAKIYINILKAKNQYLNLIVLLTQYSLYYLFEKVHSSIMKTAIIDGKHAYFFCMYE